MRAISARRRPARSGTITPASADAMPFFQLRRAPRIVAANNLELALECAPENACHLRYYDVKSNTYEGYKRSHDIALTSASIKHIINFIGVRRRCQNAQITEKIRQEKTRIVIRFLFQNVEPGNVLDDAKWETPATRAWAGTTCQR